MILYFSNGKQIRGDLILSSVIRSDMAPIPVTLEAAIRAGESDVEKLLSVGSTITDGGGDEFSIIKAVRTTMPAVQGNRPLAAIKITAFLSACQKVAWKSNRAIIKENASLHSIYRSTGASLKSIKGDFPVSRFYCLAGETPTFHIARVLQEEGGIVRWARGGLEFMRLPDLFKQPPKMTISASSEDDTSSGFLERHQVPWFFSTNALGGMVFGNRSKARSAVYSPHKSEQQLRNMTRCLVQKKVHRIAYDRRIGAGDILQMINGPKYAVITAAHSLIKPDSAAQSETFTKVWLGEIEGD